MTSHGAWADRLGGATGLPPAWLLAAAGVAASLLGAFVLHRLMRTQAAALAKRTRGGTDDLLVAKLAVPLALAVAWTGSVLSARLIAPDAATDALLAGRVLPSGLVAIAGYASASLALALFRAHAHHAHSRGVRLLGRFGGVFVTLVVALTLFALWDVEVTPLLASVGIIGIALALAAQESLANLFAGVAIYLDHMYRVGDYVVLDQGKRERIRGEIVDVGLRSTRIRTRDDVVIIVPNSDIANARIVNESADPFGHRIRVDLVVAYGSDPERVEEALLRSAQAVELVLKTPAPRVRFRDFHARGMRVELLAWILDPRDRGLVTHELIKTLHRELEAEGIEIPRVPTMEELLGDAPEA